ncbi:SpoIIE family protein phosphatase, partial [Psychrosphaera sp.]|nr:SpoIIE family protein phosphatase [Psychrosphaera sp.]
FLSKPFDQVILAAKIEAHARTRELSKKTFEQKKRLDYYKNQTEREFQIVELIYERALSNNYINESLITTHLAPAETFNGDIVLTALSPRGNVYVFMGDFTGHGLAASIGTLPVSRAFYALTNKGLSVPDIASEINKLLYNLLPTEMFCAAAIVELNYSATQISVWAGGVPDLYLVDCEAGIKKAIPSMHMPLGILPVEDFDDNQSIHNVEKRDRLFIYSDGLIELESESGELFGENRLETILSTTAKSHIDSVLSSVSEFKGNGVQNDDITIIELICDVPDLPNEQPQTFSSIPQQQSIKLHAEQLKQINPISEITDTICSIKGVLRHKSNIFLLLSEAYNNALEHGVLKMDSTLKRQKDGFVKYYAEREKKLTSLDNHFIEVLTHYIPTERKITIEVTDSGEGFDYQIQSKYQNDNEGFGRGIKLISEIASKVKYNDIGNGVYIEYIFED